MQLDLDRPGDSQILGQRACPIGRDVRAPGGEPLVLDHERVRILRRDRGRIRDRVRGVAGELVEGVLSLVLVGGRLEGGLAVLQEVERTGLGRRGPGVVALPVVGPGLEHPGGGGRVPVAGALEVVLEEGQLDLLAEELGRLGVEPDGAQGVARPVVPAAMPPAAVDPGAHDEQVLGVGRGFVDGLIGFQGAVEVLGIVPTADGHHGGADVLEVSPEGAGLPEFVVVRVGHLLLPEGVLPLEISGVGVGQGPELQEEVVGVGRAVVEVGRRFRGRLGAFEAEHGVEVERLVQEERAVVVDIVAEEPVDQGRLGRDRLERRVGVDQAGGGVEARIRDAPEADLAVVVRHVLDQPIDRVERVAALVDVLGPGLLDDLRADVHERPAGAEAAPHVLIRDNVSRLAEQRRGPEILLVAVDPVGLDAVRGPHHDDRVFPGRILGGVDGREERHAVAHGDLEVVFRVSSPGRTPGPARRPCAGRGRRSGRR